MALNTKLRQAVRPGLSTVLALALILTMVAGSAGVAAASPSDKAGEVAADQDHPQEDKEQDHKRAENYDGGQSDTHAINGLASACQTSAQNSPEGSTWCSR